MFWIGYPCSSGPLERDDGVQKRLGCFLADDGLPHWGGPGVCLVCLVLRWRDGFGSWAQDPEAVCVSGSSDHLPRSVPRSSRRTGNGV